MTSANVPHSASMMARASVAGEGNSAPRNRTKAKTGCATCRTRKVKCDEMKPFCQRCTNTGRKCDGYESPFRAFTNKSINDAHAGGVKPNVISESISLAPSGVSPEDIDLLNRCFSTKTILDVKLDCDEEARQILQASLSDPPMRHAISSLRTLREDLETSGDGPAFTAHQTLSHNYGIEQYSMALGGLASNLSLEGPNGLKSALLCCQLFISIEELRKNYGSMAQHMIRGLRIMHEYRARPSLSTVNKLVPAYHEQLPLLDVFIIKMFAAPCKFADARTNAVETESSMCSLSSLTEPPAAREARKIAPDIRPGLVKIAMSTLEFLDKVSQIESVGAAVQLLSQKMALLDSLESWIMNLELIQTNAQSPASEPVSTSFMRLLYLILKTTILGAMDSSPDLPAKIEVENDRLQGIANNLTERVRNYIRCQGTGSSQGSSPQSVDSRGRTA